MNRKAFSLVELAVVIAIMALLVGAGVTMGSDAVKSAEIISTKERLATLQEAVEHYIRLNNRLPRPSDRRLRPSDANFGKGTAGADVNGGDYQVGAVPVRDLGLPDAYAADAWGNKFTYGVSTDLAYDFYNTAPGALEVRTGEANGTNYPLSSKVRRVAPSSVAQVQYGPGATYVIVSHGPNGAGAYPQNGTAPGVPCGGDNEYANCANTNNVFWDADFNDSKNSPGYFDDLVVWGSNVSDMPPVDITATVTPTSCVGSCEAWCAPCIQNLPVLSTPAPGGMENNGMPAVLCRKIITSASPCEATCIWSGWDTVSGDLIRCP